MNLKKFFKALSCLLLLLIPYNSTYAWGDKGHQLIAEVAQKMLSPNALSALDSLRKQVKEDKDMEFFKTGQIDHYFKDENISDFFLNANLNLSLMAYWPDAWKFIERETSSWHYIESECSDITRDVRKDDIKKYAESHTCHINQLPKQIEILKDTSQSATKRLKALFFVVHLVGDLHQPLHCGSDKDFGGNKKRVNFFGIRTNLHILWDVYLLPREKKYLDVLVDDVTRMCRDRHDWLGLDITDWCLESYNVAKTEIYPEYPIGKPVAYYGRKYQDQMYPIVQEQLAKASARLAHILNTTLE